MGKSDYYYIKLLLKVLDKVAQQNKTSFFSEAAFQSDTVRRNISQPLC